MRKRVSESCLEVIRHYESLHDGDLSLIGLQPKMCPAGVWTEGYGEVILYNGAQLKGKANKELAYKLSTIKTPEEAEKRLLNTMIKFENIVNNKLTVDVTQNQFDALVSYTYNTGGSSTLFKLINTSAPQIQIFNWICQHYITVDGDVLDGLVYRRHTEAVLFTEGKIKFFN